MPLPTLSVIMPNYNHSRFLPLSLTAILEQSARPLEVIIVDDGSTDNSVEVIQGFVERDPVVRLIRNERNQGVIATIVRGLEAARGEYLFLSAADDYILPGFFEKSLSLLAAHPEAGLSFTFHSLFDDRTGKVTVNRFDFSSEPCYLSPQQLAAERECYLGGHTVISQRAAFIAAGGYLPELHAMCDWFCYQVMMARHGACFIPETLSLFRVMPEAYHKRCWNDREVRLEMLTNMLHRLLSPEYRDVLPCFQTSCILRGVGMDLVYAACQAQLHTDPDVVALVAAVDEGDLAALARDPDADVRDLSQRALHHRLTTREGGLGGAVAQLYRENHELRAQLQQLKSFVEALRDTPPFLLRRRLSVAFSKLREALEPWMGPVLRWIRKRRAPVRPLPLQPES